MKILVTGGAGFIGSNVVDRYLEEGHEVVVIDNLSTGTRENVHRSARFYEADIREAEFIDKIFREEKPEIVNHHAAQIDVRYSVNDPVFDASTNILGSLNLILSSVKHGVQKFIYISTGGAIYGEPQYLPVDEDHPICPESQYGISKHTVEHYLHLYQRLAGLDYIILRYPNVYGPRQNPKGEAGVIAIFIGKMLEGITPTIFGDGEQLRDYIHVNDVVRASLLGLKKGGNEVFNLGSGIGTSVNKLYRLLSDMLSFGSPPHYANARDGEIDRIYLKAEKAHRQLGWQVEISLEEGLKQTLEWYREKPQVVNAGS